jgi:hypothetical protein
MRGLAFSLMLAVTCWGVPVWADARLTVLLDRLRLDEVTQLYRDEGIAYASTLNDDMLDGQGGGFWETQVSRIYDPQVMGEHIRAGFEETMSDAELAAALLFYDSALGDRLVSLENAARTAMMDEDVEEAALAAYKALRAKDDPSLEALDALVADADLVDRNVAAAMSSNLSFYQGLSEGKYLSLSADAILNEIWSQEETLRRETEDWLYSYFVLAYQSLPPEDLQLYVRFSQTEAGRSMTRALFAGHDRMYRAISYALGRAVALSAAGSTL